MADDAFDEEPRRGPHILFRGGEFIYVNGSAVPPGHPANPKQRVGNARRDPTPYKDLRREPNLTGTFFDESSLFRVFMNHVGGHIEGLLTVVSTDLTYHVPADNGRDRRLPSNWGLPPKDQKVDPPPLAFRFAGDWIGQQYVLYVPRWIGRWYTEPRTVDPDDDDDGSDKDVPPWAIGRLEPRSDTHINVRLEWPFVERWPEWTKKQLAKLPIRDTFRTRLVRHDSQPVLLDRYLARESIPFNVRTQYWFCMTPQQVRELPSFAARIQTQRSYPLDPQTFLRTPHGQRMDLYDLLMAERELGMGQLEQGPRHNVLSAIDFIVDKVFEFPHGPSVPEGAFGVSHDLELRSRVLRLLDDWQLEATAKHPKEAVSTALLRALDRAFPNPGEFRNLEKHLGLGPRGWRKFRYELELDLFELISFEDEDGKRRYEQAKKASKRIRKVFDDLLEQTSKPFKKFKRITKYFPVGTLFGWARVTFVGTIEYADPSRTPGDRGVEDPPWVAEFGFFLSGIKLDKSAGDGLVRKKGISEQWGPRPATPEELVGALTYAQGEAVGLINVTGKGEHAKDSWGGKVGYDKAFLSFLGSSQNAVGFWLDGAVGENSSGLGAGLMGLGGYAWLLAGHAGDVEIAPDGKEEDEFDDYWSDRVAELAVHFPINGARIPKPTDDEMVWMFENQQLSVGEALEAFAACELPLLSHPYAGIRIDGFADAPGTVDDNEELSKNRAKSVWNYLRSLLGDALTWSMETDDLRSTGRLVIEGHGEPDPSRKSRAERSEEEFDPLLRRADVSVKLRNDLQEKQTHKDQRAAGIRLMPRK